MMHVKEILTIKKSLELSLVEQNLTKRQWKLWNHMERWELALEVEAGKEWIDGKGWCEEHEGAGFQMTSLFTSFSPTHLSARQII